MSERQYYSPPRFAAFLLRYLVGDHFDTPVGDFEEFYNEIARERGERAAKWWYRGQVLRLIPDQLVEKALWGTIMFKNYLLVGGRNLTKNKVASSINILGLSAAVGSAIALLLFVQVLNSYDQIHDEKGQLYLIGHVVEPVDNTLRRERLRGSSPVPLAPALVSAYSQIERAVRFSSSSAMVHADGNAFRERISFADTDFFDLLNFPLAQGSPSVISDPGSVILSAEMAEKYFGDEDALGKQIVLSFARGSEETLLVGAVAEPFPELARFTFDILLGYEKRLSVDLASMQDWSAYTDATFLLINDAEDIPFLESEMDRYIPQTNATDGTQPIENFFLDSVGSPDFFEAWLIEGRALEAPRPIESGMFGILAMLMLLVSCFNYISISLGSAARRLKEIGIRKTTGADKTQLVAQFLTENLLICALAIVGGVLFAWSAAIPFVNSMVRFDIPPGYLADPVFWQILGGLLVFVGVISGSYPAFYISSFQPVEILRGSRKLGEKKALTRTLTTIQFVLTIGTITFATFAGTLDDRLKVDDWGYPYESIVTLPVQNQDHIEVLENAAVQISEIERVAGTRHSIGSAAGTVSVKVASVEERVTFFAVGPEYLSAMGLRVADGRVFDQNRSVDDSTSIVINQTMAESHDWESAVGESVRIDERSYTVVGVVDDFLLSPLVGKKEPAIFGLAGKHSFDQLIVRVAGTNPDRAVAALREVWEAEFPEIDFSYYTQQEVVQADSMDGLAVFMSVVAAFALLISSMGLFGLASQRVALRIKEVGVRKTMGASAAHVIFVVNREFLIMLGVATMIATPLCYLLFSNKILQFTTVDLPESYAPFVIANVLVFLVAALSLSLQSYRLVKVSPADVLRVN